MEINENQIIILFVSTGRCGTTRIAEILSEKSDLNKVVVRHQMKGSRLYNILGNLMYFVGSVDMLKRIIFKRILKASVAAGEAFVSTDPLISMVIPKNILKRDRTYIIHLYRDPDEFSNSFYRYTKKKKKSFIAHNFIPLWQPYLWPLENWVRGKDIRKKYKYISMKKRDWFKSKYESNPNYEEVKMEELFKNDKLLGILSEADLRYFNINQDDLNKKSNQS